MLREHHPCLLYTSYETVISHLPSGYQTQQAFTQLAEAHKMVGEKFDYNNVNTVIDLLYTFTAQQWDSFVAAFPAVGQAVTDAGVNAVEAIENMQSFFGLNIADVYKRQNIGRFQNICLSLGIVTIENVGSLIQFHMQFFIITVILKLYGLNDHGCSLFMIIL